jgi:hypothetical protein
MGIAFHAKVLRAKLLREKLFDIDLVGNKNTLPTLQFPCIHLKKVKFITSLSISFV